MGEMTGETTGEQGSRRTGGRRGAARAGLGLAVGVGAALLLAACGGGGEAGGDEAKTGSSAKPSATVPAEGGKQDAELATRTTELGKVLTDGRGYTLYTFDKDTAKTSACTGKCAALWPPVTGTPQGGAGLPEDTGTLKRPDGATQATYDGHALYRFAKDTAPGKTAGDGVKGVWHAVVIAPATDGAS